MIRIPARRYAFCYHCTGDMEDPIYTVQWVIGVDVPTARGGFGNRSPIRRYVCQECGGENL